MRNVDRRICKTFSNNLKYYMKLNGESRKDLCSELEIKYSTLSNWLSCYSYASANHIEKLAEHFEISKYQLIEDNDKEHIEIKPKPNKRRELIRKTAELSDEQLNILLSMANQFLKEK